MTAAERLALLGAVLLALVSVGRAPGLRALWASLPAWLRPCVPVALGLVAGVAEALVAGTPWQTALVGGAVAGLPALLAAAPSQVVG